MSRRIWVGVLVAGERGMLSMCPLLLQGRRESWKELQFHFYVFHSIKASLKRALVLFSFSLVLLLHLNNSVVMYQLQLAAPFFCNKGTWLAFTLGYFSQKHHYLAGKYVLPSLKPCLKHGDEKVPMSLVARNWIGFWMGRNVWTENKFRCFLYFLHVATVQGLVFLCNSSNFDQILAYSRVVTSLLQKPWWCHSAAKNLSKLLRYTKNTQPSFSPHVQALNTCVGVVPKPFLPCHSCSLMLDWQEAFGFFSLITVLIAHVSNLA